MRCQVETSITLTVKKYILQNPSARSTFAICRAFINFLELSQQEIAGLGLGAVHAVPTVAKQTVKYKTAAFEPVEADTPADAQLIELKV